MLAQELKSADAVDFMGAIKPFDGRVFADAQEVVTALGAGVFVAHPLVGCHAVVVTPLHHKGPGTNEPTHFGVVIGVAHVPFKHFIFAVVHIAVNLTRRDIFPDPLVVITGANGEAIAFKNCGYAHGRFTPIAQAVKGNAIRVHKGEASQPIEGLVVLSNDIGEE